MPADEGFRDEIKILLAAAIRAGERLPGSVKGDDQSAVIVPTWVLRNLAEHTRKVRDEPQRSGGRGDGGPKVGP
jgi:hypothetical protein